MSEELIDEYIDQPAFKAQTDFAVNEVNRLLSSFDSLKKAKADIASSKGLGDISAGVRQAEKDTQLLLRTQILVANQKKAEIALDNEILKNARLKEQAADRLLKKEEQAAAAKAKNVDPVFENKTGNTSSISTNVDAVNDLDKAQAAAAISAAELGNSVNKSTAGLKDQSKAVDGVKKSTHDLNKELELKKQLDRQATQELKNTVREENAVKGSLEQRRAALIRLNAVYDNQGPQERASAAGQRLQKIIGGLDTQVKTLESTTGRSQRNVGNYASAFDKVKEGAGKAFGALRTLANIIPGLGIGGIFLAGFEAIKFFVSALNSAKTSLFNFSEQQKLSSQINEEASASAAKEQASLLVTKARIENVLLPMEKRLQSIKDLKKEFPGLFDGLTNEQLLTGNVADAYDKATASILRKARASAATAEIEKIAATKFEILRKAEEDRVKTLEKLRNAKDFVGGDADGGAALTVSKEATKQLITNEYNARAKAAQDLIDLENKKQQFLLQFVIAGSNDSVVVDKEKKTKEKKAAIDNLQALKDILDNQFKEYEIAQKRKISNFERDLASDKVHYFDKIIILKDFYEANKELLEKQAQEEKRLALEKANSETQKLREESIGKSVAEKQRINDNIAIIEDNLATQLKTINIKLQDDLVGLAQNTTDKKVKIDEDYLKAKKEFLDQELSYEQYTADQIDKIRKKQADELAKQYAAEKTALKDLNDAKVTLAEKAAATLFNIGSGLYQKQINDIKGQQDEIDIQKERELAANDALVQSEQSKAANIAIINQRAADEKAKLDRKSKEIELQKARFERVQQVFEVGIETIKAIAKIKLAALSAINPAVKALILSQIPVAIATGAASIVGILAQPLPRLFRGKKRGESINGPLAMVNDNPDGVTPEVIEHADGSLEFPQGRNVVTPIATNDIVHPSIEAFERATLSAAHRDTNRSMPQKQKGDNQLAAALIQQTKILKEIARKPVATTQATDRGLMQVMHWGAKQIKYLTENTNWHG